MPDTGWIWKQNDRKLKKKIHHIQRTKIKIKKKQIHHIKMRVTHIRPKIIMDRLRAHAKHSKEKKKYGEKIPPKEQQTGRKFVVAKLCMHNRKCDFAKMHKTIANEKNKKKKWKKTNKNGADCYCYYYIIFFSLLFFIRQQTETTSNHWPRVTKTHVLTRKYFLLYWKWFYNVCFVILCVCSFHAYIEIYLRCNWLDYIWLQPLFSVGILVFISNYPIKWLLHIFINNNLWFYQNKSRQAHGAIYIWPNQLYAFIPCTCRCGKSENVRNASKDHIVDSFEIIQEITTIHNSVRSHFSCHLQNGTILLFSTKEIDWICFHHFCCFLFVWSSIPLTPIIECYLSCLVSFFFTFHRQSS